MCIPYRQRDPKTRRLMVIGNFALVLGLALWLLVHPTGRFQKDWLDAACGFLLGLSIAINLYGLWFARHCREKQP